MTHDAADDNANLQGKPLDLRGDGNLAGRRLRHAAGDVEIDGDERGA